MIIVKAVFDSLNSAGKKKKAVIADAVNHKLEVP